MDYLDYLKLPFLYFWYFILALCGVLFLLLHLLGLGLLMGGVGIAYLLTCKCTSKVRSILKTLRSMVRL